MQNNIQKLTPQQKTKLAQAAEIKELNQALYNLQFKIIDYVRNAKNSKEARARAASVTSGITSFLQSVLVISQPSANASAAEQDDAREAIAKINSYFKCPPGMIWDPVTETCIPA